MTIFIIITYSNNFSNEVVKYFKSQNVCNHFNFYFLPIGLDENDEEIILTKIHEKINEFKNVDTIAIFSDAGLPTKFAKRILIKDPNISFYRSTGSIIENGFLTYMMLNTKAPKETIETVLDCKIDK
ncbi:hypothetical protein ACJA28_02460 [Mesomycoplasma moatsii]|uniref:hypothetical protein n=1 Tax=Mesomycoplasma moatsii TaxID=171287 RepID=UPI0003B35BE3